MYTSAILDSVPNSSSNPTPPSPSPDASSSPPPLFSTAALFNGSNVLELLKGTDHDASGKLQHDRKDNIWSVDATSCLLEAFEGKWNALRRGNLRCSNWEEVAAEVNMRCGVSRTGEQCRHKIEKLRRKYREEKALSDRLRFGRSKWLWYDTFDAMLGHKPKDSAIFSSNDVAPKTSCTDVVDHFDPLDLVDSMPLWLKSQCFMDSEPKSNMNAPDLAPAKIESDDASFTSSSQKVPRGLGLGSQGLGTTKIKVAGKASAKRRTESNILPALKSFMDGILRIEQHKMELQKDNERLRCEMELKRTEILVSLELKRTQMQLEMLKALTKSNNTKDKRAKTNLSVSPARGP